MELAIIEGQSGWYGEVSEGPYVSFAIGSRILVHQSLWRILCYLMVGASGLIAVSIYYRGRIRA